MSIYQRTVHPVADAQRVADDVSEQDEEAMVNDYREQVHFDDGMEELDRTTSLGGQLPDMQAQLMAAATPLEYQASLDVKFQSYDNYCNLFHYILNSDGPVEIEAPSASAMTPCIGSMYTDGSYSLTGHGMSLMNSYTNSNHSVDTGTVLLGLAPQTRMHSLCARIPIHGGAILFSMSSTL